MRGKPNYAELGQEPKKQLLRRGDILRWTGVTKREFDLITSVDPPILPFKTFRPNGARFYRKTDVERVFFKHFKG